MKWIDVKKKLPKDSDDEVLVYAPNCKIIGPVLLGRYFDDTDTWTVYEFEGSNLDELVLAWMPLPELPSI